jgi:hypothetical protein
MGRRALLLGLVSLLVVGCSVSRPRAPASSEILQSRINVEACPVHGVKLVEAIEPLSHVGPPQVDLEYHAIRKREFPYAFTDMRTGGLETHWRARFCPRCREIQAEWDRKWRSRTVEAVPLTDQSGGSGPQR